MDGSLPFPHARASTVAERALERCAQPECRAHAPDGEAVPILPLRRGPTGGLVGDELDNAVWLCARCAAAVHGARERLPPRLLRRWAEEASRAVARWLPPLPEVRVRPLRDVGAGVHELIVGNRDDRLPIEVSLDWQWPEAVQAPPAGGDAATALVPLDVGPREFVTRVTLAAGARRSVRLLSAPVPEVAELLAPGRREARSLFGRGVMTFEAAGGRHRRTFVVPLDYDQRSRELTSIAVDDDVATWSLRDRRTV